MSSYLFLCSSSPTKSVHFISCILTELSNTPFVYSFISLASEFAILCAKSKTLEFLHHCDKNHFQLQSALKMKPYKNQLHHILF